MKSFTCPKCHVTNSNFSVKEVEESGFDRHIKKTIIRYSEELENEKDVFIRQFIIHHISHLEDLLINKKNYIECEVCGYIHKF